MAEMAIAAFSGLSTLATGATAALGSSLSLSVLGGVATAGSVIMGLQQAGQERFAGDVAAREAGFNAEVARTEGERQATQSAARAVEIRRAALERIGAARVAFAGSGLDISSRQLGAIEDSIAADATYGLDMEKANQRIARASADVRAGQYETQGVTGRIAANARANAATLGGFVTGAKGLLSLARRG